MLQYAARNYMSSQSRKGPHSKICLPESALPVF